MNLESGSGRILGFGLRFTHNGRIYESRTSMTERLRGAMCESLDRRSHRARKQSPELARAYGMSMRLFDTGRNAFNSSASISFTSDQIRAILLDVTAPGTWSKTVTGATNANPVVYSSVGHGFSNNDVLVLGGIGGNLSANQTGLATAVAANTFDLNTLEGVAVAGSGAFTTNGYAINLTQAVTIGDLLGTNVAFAVLAGRTSSRGVANATSPVTWNAVPAGHTVTAIVYYDNSFAQLLGWQDGKVRVKVQKAVLALDTSIIITPLTGQLWDGVTGAAPVIWWSDGHSSTLNAAANQGDDSLTITAQAAGGVALNSTADVAVFGGGLPFATSGASVSLTIGTVYFPTNPTGIYAL
jgi:hypothetical protein